MDVPAEVPDRLLADVPLVDLMKIDVEGSEYQAIRGMRGLLERGSVRRVVLEWNRRALGAEGSELLRTVDDLVAAGAKLAVIADDGEPRPVDTTWVARQEFLPFVLVDLR